MSARTLTIAAFVLLAIGALAGFIPVSAQGANCGSAFARSTDATAADLGRALQADAAGVDLDALSPAQDACDSLRSVIRIPAIVFLAGGVVALLAAAAANGRAHTAAVARARRED